MTKESKKVLTIFGSSFIGLLLLMFGLSSLMRSISVSEKAPWDGYQPSAQDIHEGRKIMERNGCFSCHRIDGFGGDIGPALNGVRTNKSREELSKWIKSPMSIKPNTRMPQFYLSDEDILKIVSYLETK